MSHEVETMAFKNEVPWHGLGVRVDKATNVAQMMKLAKINWTVDRRPMSLENGKVVDDFAALVRSSDGSILDVVGSKYQPVQNSEAFEFFNEFVEAGDASMETAGSLRNGRYVWGLANLGDAFKLKGNDTVKGYVLVGCPHEQGKSLVIKLTPVRVVCNNTLTLALRQGGQEFRMVHRAKFDKDMIKKAKETLGIAREQFDEFHQTAEKLVKIKMTRDDVLKVLRPVFAPKVKDADWDKDALPPRLVVVMQSYEKAPGAQIGTAWGCLNAVSHYLDHVASRTADKRLTVSWFGRGAAMKQKVMADLMTL